MLVLDANILIRAVLGPCVLSLLRKYVDQAEPAEEPESECRFSKPGTFHSSTDAQGRSRPDLLLRCFLRTFLCLAQNFAGQTTCHFAAGVHRLTGFALYSF